MRQSSRVLCAAHRCYVVPLRARVFWLDCELLLARAAQMRQCRCCLTALHFAIGFSCCTLYTLASPARAKRTRIYAKSICIHTQINLTQIHSAPATRGLILHAGSSLSAPDRSSSSSTSLAAQAGRQAGNKLPTCSPVRRQRQHTYSRLCACAQICCSCQQIALEHMHASAHTALVAPRSESSE